MGAVKSFIILCFCLLAVQDALCRRQVRLSHHGKIVGGYNTTIENFPYQVYLLLRRGTDYFQCGGSILNDQNILTAAHCLAGMQEVFVRAGSTNSDEGGTMYSTTSFSQHPRYNARTSDYDVGVVTLRQRIPLDGTNMKAVTLVSRGASVPAGDNVTVSGWGATSENGPTSKNLMAVQVPVVSNADCKTTYGKSITSRMFCAGVPEGGKDSCQGDSGGPVVFSSSEKQAGVVSFGIGCAREGTPGVYSNLANSAIRTWIKLRTGV
ncbi:trypsin-like [Colias croceus]|uniref:trypsin-like n=1 Tax=Colias crocea TaxID=72248 RepID=UPI001E2814D0|nr:trypsin-like [Colias croceus]